ncbi:unnamed protein product, partial [Discosporangium mesarthrocarpum]
QCVGLVVRLTAALGRAGKSERHADALLEECELRGRQYVALEHRLVELLERCRAAESEGQRVAAGLAAVESELHERLRASGEESVKLRRALRDAEGGKADAEGRLERARAEGAALRRRLREERESHRQREQEREREHMERLKASVSRLQSSGRSRQAWDGGKGPGRNRGRSRARARARARGRVRDEEGESSGTEERNKESEDGTGSRQKANRQEMPSRVHGGSRRMRDGVKSGSGQAHGRHIGTARSRSLAAAYLRDTVCQLDSESFAAERRALALEWELRTAREEAIDATAAMEQARSEAARLSARLAVAEAAALAQHSAPSPSFPANTTGPPRVEEPSMGGGCFATTTTSNWSMTEAAVSLLEKRLAAALEDLVVAEGARAAAVRDAQEQRSRAKRAEGEVVTAQSFANTLQLEVARQKVEAAERVKEEALTWRRELRAEVEQWWGGELTPLRRGLSLD